MKQKIILPGRECVRARRSAAIVTITLASLAGAINLQAQLPAIPKGVSVLNTGKDKALTDAILGNPDIDMISIYGDWTVIQPDEASFETKSITDTIMRVAGSGKSALLRIRSMGGSQTNGGNIPDWVYDDMGVDPTSTTAIAGTTYAFPDDDSIRCIPVFWEPVYLAKKKALIAKAGAALTKTRGLKVVAISYANAITDDWNIPNDETTSPSEVALWLNGPNDDPRGASYTTQKMIDAAIHMGDASFTDGVLTGGMLTSASATFTQADIGLAVTFSGTRAQAHVKKWLSPTQVILDKSISIRNVVSFTIVARRDGLIDVAMAAFPNQYIAGAVGGNGPDLDAGYDSCDDVGTCLAMTVDNMVQTTYPGRYIVQRNNVSAVIPFEQDADSKTGWILLSEAVDAGIPTAGQALGTCWNNTTYRMNQGDDCDKDRPECVAPCDGDCALSYDEILTRSADRIASYSANYYEIYPPDATNLTDAVTYIHEHVNGTTGGSPKPAKILPWRP